VGRIDAVCNLSRRLLLLHGCAHHPATTHTAAAIVWVYFLTVHQTSLLVSHRYCIAESEAADFAGSIRSNFGWIIQPLVIMFVDMPSSASETASELSDDDSKLPYKDGNKRQHHFQETAK